MYRNPATVLMSWKIGRFIGCEWHDYQKVLQKRSSFASKNQKNASICHALLHSFHCILNQPACFILKQLLAHYWLLSVQERSEIRTGAFIVDDNLHYCITIVLIYSQKVCTFRECLLFTLTGESTIRDNKTIWFFK